MGDVYVAAAIPVFFAAIVAELGVSSLQGRSVYRFNDAVSCLSCGITHLVVKGLYYGVLFTSYLFAAEHLAVMEMSASSPWTWLFGVLAVDHQYYWWHRATHRSKLLWATHVEHHQSEDYNLAVALRQSWTSSITSMAFYLPLAVLGLPVEVFLVCDITNTLYQFWIHTECVRTLGPLEWVLNTPAHHRVHHAVNPKYIDKNYAGFLIIWDRAYGTFTEETTAPTYGTVKPLRSFNPVWANVGPFIELTQQTLSMPRWQDRLFNLVAPPEWMPESMGGTLTIPEPEPHRVSWDPSSSLAVHLYIAMQFLVVASATTVTLLYADSWSLGARLGAAGLIVFSTWTWSQLFEQRVHAREAELTRLVFVSAYGIFEMPHVALGAYVFVSAAAFLALSVPVSILDKAGEGSRNHG